jgi:hypothetical protein
MDGVFIIRLGKRV